MPTNHMIFARYLHDKCNYHANIVYVCVFMKYLWVMGFQGSQFPPAHRGPSILPLLVFSTSLRRSSLRVVATMAAVSGGDGPEKDSVPFDFWKTTVAVFDLWKTTHLGNAKHLFF